MTPPTEGGGRQWYQWDWLTDESLPHRGRYVVRHGDKIVVTYGPFKADYERAKAKAAALNGERP